MNRRTLPAHVAVAGGGPVAFAAALAFAQAMPGTRVTLIPAPVPDAALADRWPLALPSAHAMLARLHCPPDMLLAHGVATPRLATRFLDWSADGTAWMVADEPAPPLAGAPLHQLWLRAGAPMPFHALHPACVAAEAGLVPRNVEPGLHLDARRLRDGLASLARQAGVVLANAPLAEATGDTGGVEALQLTDGGRIEADLVIDATGPARLVATSQGFEGWGDSLPCHHLRLEPSVAAPSPIDSHRAVADGWTATWPGASVRASRDAAPGAIALVPGRLSAPMRGNVLALGEAAVQPGPLGLTGFTLALAQIALALELLPTGADMPLLSAEYNRRANQRADRMRDFLAAHYIATTTPPAMTPSLATMISQFERRGTLPPADEDSVERDAWIAVLIGQGLRPERPDPIALGIPREVARRAVLDRAGQWRAAAGRRGS